MHIERVLEVSDEILGAIQRLIPELGLHKAALTWEELTALVKSESSTLWIARYPDQSSEIAGILSITIYRVPTGMRSIVEDLVVDQSLRRRGVARALLSAAVEFARDAGASGVALTSNPRREAANFLYQSMGFERRETNSYYYKIK